MSAHPLLLILLAGTLEIAASPQAITHLQRNVKQGFYKVEANELKVFCYGGEKSWSRIWSSLEFVVDSEADEFTLDVADNASILLEQFSSHWHLWSLLTTTTSNVVYQKSTSMSPYGMSCVGLSYHGANSVHFCVILKESVISYKFPFLLICGVMLLLSANRLSRSVSFHYTSGVAIGIVASVLILVYLVSKLVPTRPMAYSVLFGGWAMVVWLFSEVKSNLLPLITSYPHYVIIYVVTVGVASFLFCHWMGPFSHPRTFQVIQWTIQLVAMVLIYHATQLMEASVILLVIICLFYLMRNKVSSWIKKFYWHNVLLRWYTMFPPKHVLLTKAEYKEESERETALALEQLRDFCRQNNEEVYRHMARLKSPNRFSRFLDGNFHLTDSEVQEYHRSVQDSDNDEIQ